MEFCHCGKMGTLLCQVQGHVIPGLNVQIQDHQGITAWIPAVGGGVDWDPFHRLGRSILQQLQDVVLTW